MSDVAQGAGWWQATDGKWYPPREAEEAPAPGWWLAADGKWYPPREAEEAPAPGWWLAADGKWYPPVPADDTSPGPEPDIDLVGSPADRTAAAPPTSDPIADPIEAIDRRNQASRADAEVLNPARARAAARALASLGSELTHEREAEQHRPDRVAPPPTAPAPVAAPRPEREQPLLEIKPSPLGVDVEHLGERLAVFEDRVELRDRSDRVRDVVAGEDIIDVVVQKRLSGTVLAIEMVDGPSIVLKGLRLDQAEDAREAILRHTRRAGPGDHSSRSAEAGGPPLLQPQPHQATATTNPRINEADLLRKLSDLHRAGVLNDEEFGAKIDLVGRLVRGEDLSPTTT